MNVSPPLPDNSAEENKNPNIDIKQQEKKESLNAVFPYRMKT
jgi:hypothetical protein